MSKTNPLVGLIGYGDSDESDDDVPSRAAEKTFRAQPPEPSAAGHELNAGVHPAPIPHCAWSACYDESSGFTYYWNQHTNAVTWEAPQEYLMALKLAQHQLHASGSAEVSAEEWQLYQQTLAEKQTQAKSKKPDQAKPKTVVKNGAKRKPGSDDEQETIELITSYHNSDSESNDEDTPAKAPTPIAKPATPVAKPATPVAKPAKPTAPKNPHKKQKTKPVEYGPSLPSNQNYTVPIGPELPPGMVVEPVLDDKTQAKTPPLVENDDSLEEKTLFMRLKEKAKLLEKLGGEIPTELQKMIKDDTKVASPKFVDETSRDSKIDNIDDLLDEIEKKELPKVKSKKTDLFGEDSNSGKNTPVGTPPREVKPLFPSSKAIEETPPLPPVPAATVFENGVEKPEVPEKKVNLYLADTVVKENRKKLRIDNSILPERKKTEVPAYTTKYSQYIEGFSSERTGLGFKEDGIESPKVATVSYGNGLSFTKGEVLNEDTRDEDLDAMSDLVEAKLKFLNEVQPCQVPPVQEMLIQWQTLVSAFRGGALSAPYWRRWVRAGARALRRLEQRAAPPGWTASFQRSEGRYRYRREADGFTQWEYPAAETMDMEICTTPPPEEPKEPVQPPLPPAPPPAPPAPPAAPAAPARVATPPPPAWRDPPPPGTDDPPPPPPPLPPEPKKEIGDELLSFYSDIAELEKSTPPTTGPASPELPPLPKEPAELKESKEKETKTSKKKSKVKISSSIGLKHKTVSNMVAKWQQVADEIHSD
ncbi:formin-binding protein 4-like [Cydia amplana]|uniref:formin-binding protein 4-like n=1 Tax=Cydia amplana TaxID=1869771 RepID=UPI002FE61065